MTTKFLDSLQREKGRTTTANPGPKDDTIPVVGAHVLIPEGTNDDNVITNTGLQEPTEVPLSDTTISFGTNDVAATVIVAAIAADNDDEEWMSIQGDEDCFDEFDEDEDKVIVGMHAVVNDDDNELDNSVDSTNYTMPFEGYMFEGGSHPGPNESQGINDSASVEAPAPHHPPEASREDSAPNESTTMLHSPGELSSITTKMNELQLDEPHHALCIVTI